MTTGGPARESDGRQADAGPSPGLAPRASQRNDAKTGPPDDVRELQQEVERAREQLAATVDQLVAKADVKARARDKTAELTGRAKDKADRTRAQAIAGAGTMRDQLASKTADTGQKAKFATQQFSGWLAGTGAHVREAMPEPVQRAVVKGASSARQYYVPLAAAAALMAGYLVVRSRRRR